MNKRTLEERVACIERLFKNELLGFGKPKQSDEAEFVEKLFSKYPTIDKALSTEDTTAKSTEEQTFNLILAADEAYNNIRFIISGSDRNNMSCTALDKRDLKIDTLKPFSLNTDVNTVARFILEIMKDNKSKRNEKMNRKLEAVSLSGMECRSIRKEIEDSLSDEYDSNVVVKVDSKYANLGIVVVCIYNPDLIAEYTITADDADSFKTEYNGKAIGTVSTLDAAEDNLIEHFLENFVD
jgi:hypothetical protein